MEDSLVFLCARRIIAQRPLPALPPHIYPILFKLAFLDGRLGVLRDLVSTWPFPELHFQRLLGCPERIPYDTCIKSVKAVIQAVVDQLWRELEEPGCDFSLRVLDMTIVPHSNSCHALTGMDTWCSTEDLAKACVEVSKHQQEFQRRRSKHHKDCTGADMATAAPQPLGVDIHTDLSVDICSYEILRDALQTGAAAPLRLKCREFKAECMSVSEIVTLLESLDPSCLRRVDLCWNDLGLTGLLVVLPHLLCLLELRSLKLQDISVDVQHLKPESAMTIRCVAWQLGMLPSLQELNLGFFRLSGNLHQILCDLQAPLESLVLSYCSLLPEDLTFLSQSIHAPALKRLDLRSNNISQGLLEPLRMLLEKTSASLLYLDLSDCHMTDSHLAALLPTLLRCSRLRFLRLHDNLLSTAAIKDLLQKTFELPDLHLVVYPDALDRYTQDQPEFDWDLSDEFVDDELLSAREPEISRLLADSGRTDLVWTDDPYGYRALDYFSL